jgi:hypothetical protein
MSDGTAVEALAQRQFKAEIALSKATAAIQELGSCLRATMRWELRRLAAECVPRSALPKCHCGKVAGFVNVGPAQGSAGGGDVIFMCHEHSCAEGYGGDVALPYAELVR